MVLNREGARMVAQLQLDDPSVCPGPQGPPGAKRRQRRQRRSGVGGGCGGLVPLKVPQGDSLLGPPERFRSQNSAQALSP